MSLSITLLIIGFVALAIGLTWFSPPVALIVLGAMCVTAALLREDGDQ